MDESRRRAEQLLTLSSAARRLADLIAAAGAPVQYEVLRHLVRVSEETMTEVLQEAVDAQLVRRASDPFTYVPYDDEVASEISRGIDPERVERMRRQLENARREVFE